MDADRQAEKENFGEASLGEAQAENPRPDPEMLEDTDETPAEGGTERYSGDEDPEPTGIGREPEDKEREAQRPVAEAGGGVAEGFEQAEEDLIEHASHGDPAPDPTEMAGETEAEESGAVYGEADEERVSEIDPDERTD